MFTNERDGKRVLEGGRRPSGRPVRASVADGAGVVSGPCRQSARTVQASCARRACIAAASGCRFLHKHAAVAGVGRMFIRFQAPVSLPPRFFSAFRPECLVAESCLFLSFCRAQGPWADTVPCGPGGRAARSALSFTPSARGPERRTGVRLQPPERLHSHYLTGKCAAICFKIRNFAP